MEEPMKKIAVVLSGCGFKDGAEITEAVSTLISLSQQGVQYQVFALNKEFTPTNHLTGKSEPPRQIMAEAARIARGNVKDLKELRAKDFDGIVFPGGYGAALHLCDWAKKGAQCDVDPEAHRVINEFFSENLPIAAICIAPALIARVLGQHGITVTLGNDKEAAAEIEKTGAHHVECRVDDYVTDREHKIITTPAYMYEAKPHEAFKGISGAIKELVEMA